MLILTISGFHMHSGNTLVNKNGELDLDHGKPHQISFSTTYHTFILTALAFYDEEWDFLLFQEYAGSGVIVVIWMIVAMIVGFIIFSRYMTCLLSQKLEIIIDQYEEEENG